MSGGLDEPGEEPWTGDFGASLAQFAKIGRFLTGEAAVALGHFEVEQYLKAEGFELLRLLLQDHFDLRALREVRLEQVCDGDGLACRGGRARP